MSRGVVEHVAAIHHGRVRAVLAPEPVLRAPGGTAALDEPLDPLRNPSAIVRMEVLLPPCAGGLDIFGAVSECGRQVLVDPHAVRLEIPVPHDVVRRAPEELEPHIAPPQALSVRGPSQTSGAPPVLPRIPAS